MDFRHPLSVVTPTLDGDVLAVLARAETEFSGREVHRALGHASHTGVRRCLERLVEVGIVLERRAGNALLYRLNRDHLAAPQIEALATLRLQFFERLREAVFAWEIKPAMAAVFGSVARGQADASSDIDLFLLRPKEVDEGEPIWRDQVMALEQAASAWTGNDVRSLEYSESELPRLRREAPVIGQIAEDGIAIAGDLRDLRATVKTGRPRTAATKPSR
jgi:predicted nucleotidyltransferase